MYPDGYGDYPMWMVDRRSWAPSEWALDGTCDPCGGDSSQCYACIDEDPTAITVPHWQ